MGMMMMVVVVHIVHDDDDNGVPLSRSVIMMIVVVMFSYPGPCQLQLVAAQEGGQRQPGKITINHRKNLFVWAGDQIQSNFEIITITIAKIIIINIKIITIITTNTSLVELVVRSRGISRPKLTAISFTLASICTKDLIAFNRWIQHSNVIYEVKSDVEMAYLQYIIYIPYVYYIWNYIA